MAFETRFQDTLLSNEAPSETVCLMCHSKMDPFYRCLDCHGSGVICGGCCVLDHAKHPFHKIQKWNGQYFETSSLHDIGYILFVGHGGRKCSGCSDKEEDAMMEEASGSKAEANRTLPNFTVVDTGGVFIHRIQWCCCVDAPPKFIQLLQIGLYPASITSPQTAFTFRLLDYFQLDALECHTPALNFYTKLRRLSNRFYPEEVPVSTMF
jgi:CxC2 like cysteine cluster associated with KDZ transposases